MTTTDEKQCYMYSLTQSIGHFLEGDYKKAAIHLENAKRSAEELDAEKRENAMYEQAKELLKQVNQEDRRRALYGQG